MARSLEPLACQPYWKTARKKTNPCLSEPSGRSSSAFQLSEHQLVVSWVDNADELSPAFVAAEAVAFKSAAIHEGKAVPLEPQSRGALRTADELGSRYRVCFTFSHDWVHANGNNAPSKQWRSLNAKYSFYKGVSNLGQYPEGRFPRTLLR